MSALPFAPDQLQPAAVWRHFATLCATPRLSKQEGRLRDILQDWARTQGLETLVDSAGNLLLRKPASPGRENTPGMVMQGHIDMVCQKNAGSTHDFTRDPIVPVQDGDWLRAVDTTLGADNGIGVALILAAMADTSLVHGPLEALLTVDEEQGMSGALGLASDTLRGRQMLNLDTEEWGEFFLGCAGGLDVNVQRAGTAAVAPAGTTTLRITLHGLRGGHSGIDINEERGNAIKLLVRVLRRLERQVPVRLATLRGGSARNALPRDAFATLTVPAEALGAVREFLAGQQQRLRAELQGVDEGLTLESETVPAGPVMDSADQHFWLAALHAAPHGVRRMSRTVPGIVETSNNLGMVDLGPQQGSCNFMVRSLLQEGSQALAEEIASLFALGGTAVAMSGHYPGWTPNPHSALLARCQAVYRQRFGGDTQVKVIHAGLECGIVSAAYPDMDIVSFGPTIRGAHAPGESVQISTVEKCWELLKDILAAPAP